MSVDEEERAAENGLLTKGAIMVNDFAVEIGDDPGCDEYGDLDDDLDDDRAGALLCFLMDLQAVALKSFGGGAEFDPKLYVDLPLKCSLEVTEAAFAALPKACASGAVEPDSLKAFLEEYFDEAGSDLIPYTPADHITNPPDFLPRVQSVAARDWGLKVHALWPSLTRQVSSAVETEPDRHTLLPLKNPFIVPGERFREVYYWDSYWVIRGLLASKMIETAAGMVDNFLSVVQAYGFFPNGTRTYYENRSQPPILSRMVRSIFSATGDLSLASRAVPVLLQEYEFWTTEPHEVIIRDGQGREHRLSRYSAHWDQARPECSTIVASLNHGWSSELPTYFLVSVLRFDAGRPPRLHSAPTICQLLGAKIDVIVVILAQDKSIAEGLSKLTQQQLYHDIATAAESGWDFSSRWMEDEEQLSSLKTSSIIPVDLNAFLLQMESDIAFFAKALNNASLSKRFTRAADARRRAFEAILWNEGKGQWLDYWLPLQQKPAKQRKTIYTWDSTRSNRTMYASNFVPLWCGIFPAGDSKIDQVVEALSNSGLVLPGGVATSLLETGQQWDFPNAWAPLQHMIIEGLYLSGSRKARAMAQGITVSWLRSNYTAFQRIGHMVEKYDARYCGEVGGGGEYVTQTGFGWTNGVVLTLLHDYGWPEDLPLDCVRAS